MGFDGNQHNGGTTTATTQFKRSRVGLVPGFKVPEMPQAPPTAMLMTSTTVASTTHQ